MPRRALGPCTTPTCPGLAVSHGKCERHAQERMRRYEEQRGTAAERGYGGEWQRIRGGYLRMNPDCVVCGAPAAVVDHIIPLRAGGTYDLDNLQSLCVFHHGIKTIRADGGGGGGHRIPGGVYQEPHRQFRIRARNPLTRVSSRVVRIVGAPATGKSTLRWALDGIGLETFAIDDERIAGLQPGQSWANRGDDLAAWCRLEDAIDTVSPCAVETTGRNPNDRVLLDGRRVYTVLCVAAGPVRQARLEARVRSGYRLAVGQADYVDALLRIGPPSVSADAVWDTTHDEQAGSVLAGVETWLRRTGR